MSNTVYVSTETQTINADNDVLSTQNTTNTTTYTEQNVGTLTLASSSSFTDLPFGGVTTATYCRAKSDNAFSLKFNATSTFIGNVTDFACFGSITELLVSQTSGSAIDIDYEIRG